MAGVAWAITEGSIDPNRLGVTGMGYGGFMSNWLVIQTNRFKVVVTQRSGSNLISMAGAYYGQLIGDRTYFASEIWEDPMIYWKLSTLS